MILTLQSNSAGQTWQTRIAIDFALRRWTAQAGDAVWRKLSSSTSGILEPGLVTRLKDAGSRPLLELNAAPQREGDNSRLAGDGRIVAEGSLAGQTFYWEQQALTGVDGLSDVRRKGLELLAINLPPNGLQDAPNCVEGRAREATKVNASGFRATGCGGLAGWYFQQLLNAGFPIPQARVRKTYEWTPPGKTEKVKQTDDLYLTAYIFGHHIVVKELQKARQLPVYVDFKRGSAARPQRGDVYFIRTSAGLTRHVGVFCGTDDKGWRTADGGQGASGYAVGITARRFDPGTGAISGGKEVGYVDGWIDLDQLLKLGEPVTA